MRILRKIGIAFIILLGLGLLGWGIWLFKFDSNNFGYGASIIGGSLTLMAGVLSIISTRTSREEASNETYPFFLSMVKQTLNNHYQGKGAFIVRAVHNKSSQMLFIRTLDSYNEGERARGAEPAKVQVREGTEEGTGKRFAVNAAVSYGYEPGTYVILKENGSVICKGTVRGQEVIEFEI